MKYFVNYYRFNTYNQNISLISDLFLISKEVEGFDMHYRGGGHFFIYLQPKKRSFITCILDYVRGILLTIVLFIQSLS